MTSYAYWNELRLSAPQRQNEADPRGGSGFNDGDGLPRVFGINVLVTAHVNESEMNATAQVQFVEVLLHLSR